MPTSASSGALPARLPRKREAHSGYAAVVGAGGRGKKAAEAAPRGRRGGCLVTNTLCAAILESLKNTVPDVSTSPTVEDGQVNRQMSMIQRLQIQELEGTTGKQRHQTAA